MQRSFLYAMVNNRIVDHLVVSDSSRLLSAFSIDASVVAIRVYFSDNDTILTGMTFRYRGEREFRPPASFHSGYFAEEEYTLELDDGEHVVEVTSALDMFQLVTTISFRTNRGRRETFGKADGLTANPPESAGHLGARLVGFIAQQHIVEMENGNFVSAPCLPLRFCFDNAWFRRRDVILARELLTRERASAGALWTRLEALPDGVWRLVARYV